MASLNPAELRYVASLIYDQFRQRGTYEPLKTAIESGRDVNGEILRLISFLDEDEIIFHLCNPKSIGWNIGNSSPLNKGLINFNINKSYEKTQSVVDLDLYPIINLLDCEIVTDGDFDVLQISTVASGETAGVGGDDTGFKIKINTELDYEISFFVKQPVLAANLSFGLKAFNESLDEVDLESIKDGANLNWFFQEVELNSNDIYYQVRGILFNSSAINNSNQLFYEPSIGYGEHLRSNGDALYIIPQILLDNTNDAGESLRIYGLKIQPLATEFSHGFLNIFNLIYFWLSNRNLNIPNVEIDEILRRYFIPYNTALKTIHLLDAPGYIAPPVPEPSAFTITANAPEQLALVWTDNNSGESVFEIEQSPDGITYTPLFTTAAGAESYTNTGLDDDTEYFYRIRSVLSGNYSVWVTDSETTLNPFRLTVKTDNAGTSSSTQFALPLVSGGTYNFDVWYNGAIIKSSVLFSDNIITFGDGAGTKSIAITGTLQRWSFNNTGDILKLLTISNWGGITLGISPFYGCSNLNITATDIPILISGSVFRMFDSCTNLIFNESINQWDVDVSGADWRWCFLNCTNFNQPLSNWNFRKCDNALSMFQNATSFNQNLGMWDVTSNAFRSTIYMVSMLSSCGMSTANYDSTLVGWEAQVPVSSVTLGATGRTYTSAGAGGTARSSLVSTYSWTITGDSGV